MNNLKEENIRRAIWGRSTTCSLSKDPPLILADELTAALDPETSQEIMDLLLTLKNKERLIIIATHNPTIWKQADQVVSLKISQ